MNTYKDIKALITRLDSIANAPVSEDANEQEIHDFLTFLSAQGEASDEIAGGVYVLRNKSKRVNVEDCIDTCGTGGDG